MTFRRAGRRWNYREKFLKSKKIWFDGVYKIFIGRYYIDTRTMFKDVSRSNTDVKTTLSKKLTIVSTRFKN